MMKLALIKIIPRKQKQNIPVASEINLELPVSPQIRAVMGDLQSISKSAIQYRKK